MSEVSQAAERLRRYYSEDELTAEQLYGVSCLERADELWHEDNARLAQAYLDEHAADDDEPITEEWIIATWDDPEKSLTMEYRFTLGRFAVGSINGCEFMNWKRLETRGQLRKLIEALAD